MDDLVGWRRGVIVGELTIGGVVVEWRILGWLWWWCVVVVLWWTVVVVVWWTVVVLWWWVVVIYGLSVYIHYLHVFLCFFRLFQ